MHSTNYLLNSYDRDEARRTLKMHVENGRLTTEEYENRKLLIAVAERIEDLEKIFSDIGGLPETTRTWLSKQRNYGRDLETLDIICLSGFVVFLGVAQLVLEAEWSALILPAIFLVPIIPCAIVGLNRKEELDYYEETGSIKK